MSDDAKKAKKAMLAAPQQRVVTDTDFLSTGLTLLNLAAYGRTNGGLCKGFIYRLIGRSGTAKSMLCRMILAEAARNPSFAKHKLIHDDIEQGAVLIDTEKFFGKSLANRLEAPSYTKDRKPVYSTTIMDMYEQMNYYLDKGIPFIWLVDSQDALKPMNVTKMSDGKAKIHAAEMRKINDERIAEAGSIVIFVQHAKVNMSQEFSWGPKPDVTTGGQSPEFYSTLDIRLSKGNVIKRVVKRGEGELKMPIGNWFSAHVTKNRISGMDRTIRFPFYQAYGVDDLGACIEYLVSVEHWEKQKGGIIQSEELDFEGTKGDMIRHVEAKNLEAELRVLTGKVWKEIEAACALNRKPRYS